MTVRDFFSDFPDTEDEQVKEWLKNASPFINYCASVGMNLVDEIKRREQVERDMRFNVRNWSDQWTNILSDLKEIRGKEWKRLK